MSRKTNRQAATTHVAIFTAEGREGALGAAIAGGVDAETAHAFARSFALASVDLDDRLPEGIAGRLATVAVTDGATLSLPEVPADLIDALTQLAVLQGRIKPAAPIVADGQEADEAALAAENDNAAAAASEGSETASPAAGAETAAVVPLLSDVIVQELWQKIAAGHVVLVPDYDEGEFAGFWPATVVRRTATQITLTWAGEFRDLPEFVRPPTAVALGHPYCRVK